MQIVAVHIPQTTLLLCCNTDSDGLPSSMRQEFISSDGLSLLLFADPVISIQHQLEQLPVNAFETKVPDH